MAVSMDELREAILKEAAGTGPRVKEIAPSFPAWRLPPKPTKRTPRQKRKRKAKRKQAKANRKRNRR